MKVVIIGHISETIKLLIRAQFPCDWKVAVVAPDAAAEALRDAEVVIPEHVLVDGPFLDRARHLRLVQTGAGYDNVAIDECTRRGIYVANAAGVNAVAVAEHVLSLVLCWYKNIVHLDRAMRQGRDTVDYAGSEVAGKTIGIVGLGRIGREVARLATAFRMAVITCTQHAVPSNPEIERVGLSTLLQHADVVSLHVPLNDQTRHLIGAAELASMRRDALLINTSRGAILDEAALIDALREGRIGGAGIDVFEREPLSFDSPLRGLTNVILTPHTAGMPDGAKFHRRRYRFFVENIQRVADGRPPVNALNQIGRTSHPPG